MLSKSPQSIEETTNQILALKPEFESAINTTPLADNQPFPQRITALLQQIAEVINPYESSHKRLKEGSPIAEAIKEIARIFPTASTQFRFLDTLEETIRKLPSCEPFSMYDTSKNFLEEPFNKLHKALQELASSPLSNREKAQTAKDLEKLFHQMVDNGIIYTTNPVRSDLTLITAENAATSLSMHREPYLLLATEGVTQPHSYECFVIPEIIAQIEVLKNIHSFEQTVGHVDNEKLETDRLQYGAKAANLIALQVFLKKLATCQQHGLQYVGERTIIPRFKLVSKDLYLKWKTGEDIDPELQALLVEWQSEEIIIRSSAVHAEDGQETTAAGIYDSIIIANPDFTSFKKAIIKIYESCDSPTAIAYRQEHNIPEEEMGLIIQEYASGTLGEINTSRAHTPQLMDIQFYLPRFTDAPLIVDKEKATNLVFRGPYPDLGEFYRTLHIAGDRGRSHSSRVGRIDALVIGTILERHYGRPVQIEIKDSHNKGTYLLQARPIPSQILKPANVEFPNQEPLATMSSTGVCDLTIPLLSDSIQNVGDANEWHSYKEGIIVFRSSELGSLNRRGIREQLPQSGVLIMLDNSPYQNGHVETLALERGLVVLFPGENTTSIVDIISLIQKTYTLHNQSHEPAENDPPKFRIISNGIEARIYLPE